MNLNAVAQLHNNRLRTVLAPFRTGRVSLQDVERLRAAIESTARLADLFERQAADGTLKAHAFADALNALGAPRPETLPLAEVEVAAFDAADAVFTMARDLRALEATLRDVEASARPC